MDVVVSVDGDPYRVLPAVRQKVHELDPQLPLSNVRTMDGWVTNNAAQPRLNAELLGIFAAVALAIAAIGIYGVLAYSVTQRTHEIGVRVALGAQPGGVVRLIVGEGMTVGLIGIAAGLAAALALSRALASPDRSRFRLSAIPARRAARVDPMIALRDE